jgi:hypothetical protein
LLPNFSWYILSLPRPLDFNYSPPQHSLLYLYTPSFVLCSLFFFAHVPVFFCVVYLCHFVVVNPFVVLYTAFVLSYIHIYTSPPWASAFSNPNVDDTKRREFSRLVAVAVCRCTPDLPEPYMAICALCLRQRTTSSHHHGLHMKTTLSTQPVVKDPASGIDPVVEVSLSRSRVLAP